MPEVNPWWLAAVAGAALVGFLAWYEFAQDKGDTSWTDPHQPPTILAPVVCRPRGGRIDRATPYSREYPGTLAAWPECVLGDI